MKRFAIAMLAVLMLVAGTACGNKNKTQADTLKEGESLESLMAAVDAKFTEKYGEGYGAVAMSMAIDDSYIADFLELDSAAWEEYAGGTSMSMTNSDAFFVIKAKEGQTEVVQQALEKRLADLVTQYEYYPVNGSYDRARAGEVYVKGDYVFLICVGVLADMDDESPDFSQDVQMVKETIDSMFNA